MTTRLFEAIANYHLSDTPTRICIISLYTFNTIILGRSIITTDYITAGMFTILTALFVWMDSEKYRKGDHARTH